MQRTLKLLMLVGLALVISLTGLIRAQDEAVESVNGFYFLGATEGTLEEGDDGAYTLTLEGVIETVDWVVSSPEYFAGDYDTASFVAEWAANADVPLTTTGMLRTEETTLRFTAGLPEYDPMSETLTLQLSAVEGFPVDEDAKDGGIPEDFDTATLTLVVDDAFNAGLIDGAAILAAEGRADRDKDAARAGASTDKRK